MITTTGNTSDKDRVAKAARFCIKALHEIKEIQRVCDCPSTRLTFERSIDAVKRIVHLLTLDKPFLFTLEDFPPLKTSLDSHDSLVLLSHYLRCVWNSAYPLKDCLNRVHEISDEELEEFAELLNIVKLDCENACFRAAHTPPACIV